MSRKKLPATQRKKTRAEIASENCRLSFRLKDRTILLCQHGHRIVVLDGERFRIVKQPLTERGMYVSEEETEGGGKAKELFLPRPPG